MRKYWILGIIAAGFLLPRIYLLQKFRSVLIESDEAIVGLMARHILQGELPIFYYGQPYMGTIEAYLVALLFLLFGPVLLILKIAPLLWFAAFLLLHYLLARIVTDQATSLLATTLAALSPSFLALWSMKSRGGYMALLALGTASLLLAAKMLNSEFTPRLAVGLGFCLGIAWWSHFAAIFYIVPIVVVLLLKSESRFLSRAGTALAASFMAGSLPFWIYNFRYGWTSLRMEGGPQTEIVSDFKRLFGTALPILLGARPNWEKHDMLPFLSVPVIALLIAAVVCFSIRCFGNYRPENFKAQHLLAVFALSFPLLFSACGMGWFVAEPRYLIPLYSCIYILMLAPWQPVGRSGPTVPEPVKQSEPPVVKSRFPREGPLAYARGSVFFRNYGRTVQLAIFSTLLLLNLIGSIRARHEEFIGYTNVEPDSQLIEFLRSRHIDRAWAPYWIAYRLTFETDEQIICSPPRNDMVRYQPYLNAVESAPQPAIIRLVLPRYRTLQVEIPTPEGYVMTRAGAYEVFHQP